MIHYNIENKFIRTAAVFLFIIFIFSCSNEVNLRTGNELVEVSCLSCHNYNEVRTLYQPSISKMRKTLLRDFLDSVLIDSNHRLILKRFSRIERDSIYHYIKFWNNVYEDPK
ncbi:hypothetical protein DVR12_17730 [Chitinophaga silvatica]|uniref:Cytochrome c domain-containing protein n=1 Tax=Chitinophaga silvatica TaxID=2282649 RepID=A0A3E1Y7X8_9BACT|nr:hypothetical protein DVR12_17730 [Chitinophaga silvatica]